MRIDVITRIEELILLAVLHLGDDAYGISIRRLLEERLETPLSVGAVYVPLDRLEKRGYLRAHLGEPSRTRGGRRKRFYTLTPSGAAGLRHVKSLHDTMWTGLSLIDLDRPESEER